MCLIPLVEIVGVFRPRFGMPQYYYQDWLVLHMCERAVLYLREKETDKHNAELQWANPGTKVTG